MSDLIYLTEKFDLGYPYAEETAKRLNAKGLAPKRSLVYTKGIVENAVYGRSKDDNIKHEFMLMLAEQDGKLGAVAAHINAARAILGV